MAILILAEHQHSALQAGTLNVLTAALAINSEVHILVVGHQAQGAALAAAQLAGVTKVLHIDAPHFESHGAENVAAQVQAIAGLYTHILANASAYGKNILPRVAALLDVAQISEVTKVLAQDTYERPIYAGNAIATVQSTDAIQVLTIRSTNFEAALSSSQTAPIELLGHIDEQGLTICKGQETVQSSRPELTAAKVIVSGGRGLGSAEQYKSILEPLADKMGAAMGASRAAVDAGYVPNDYQVGQTGKIVAPGLYIAVGISGAIQHLAGMKDSKIIVAINKDPEAPIFAVADYGLVADLFTAVPELVQELS